MVSSPSLLDRVRSIGWVKLFALLAVFGALERILLARLYGPVEFGDTPSYMRLASALSDWSLSGYDATRVPGYPVLLALAGRDMNTVWAIQMALGLVTSLLLFWLAWKISGSPVVGAAAGLAYDLLPGPFLFEFNLLSETLATALLTGSFVLLALLLEWKRDSARLLPIAFLAGVVASLAALSRTLFFTLPVWGLGLVLIHRWPDWRSKVLIALSYSLPALVLLGGWIGYVYFTYGMISPTTMGGYHLVQHTGDFFELVPDEHAALREVFLEYRDEQIRTRGSAANAIWDAIPAMSEISGLGFFDLSRRLQQISIELIWDHPLLYAKNVAEGWIWFWKAPVYWRVEAARGIPLVILRVWTIVGRGLALLANGSFLLLSAVAALWAAVRAALRRNAMVLAMGGYVWLSSVVQTLADHGDNPRFLVPLQPLVVLIILWAAAEWNEKRQQQPAG